MGDPPGTTTDETVFNLHERRKSFAYSLAPERVLRRVIEGSLEQQTDGGTSYFWHTCASLLPLTTAPVGFMGNISSIMSLADPWRTLIDTGENQDDSGWVLALNSVALAAGVVANILLFLNFCKLLPHNIVQTMSIVLYLCATIIYMVMFGVTEYTYYDDSRFERSQGYWQGAAASILYSIAAIFLLTNLIGHLTRRYDGEHF